MCQNSLIPALDAESHKDWPYKRLIDKACSFKTPHQARGQAHFNTLPKGQHTFNLYYRQP